MLTTVQPLLSASSSACSDPAVYANCISVLSLQQGRTDYVREIEPRTPAQSYRYSPVLQTASSGPSTPPSAIAPLCPRKPAK